MCRRGWQSRSRSIGKAQFIVACGLVGSGWSGSGLVCAGLVWSGVFRSTRGPPGVRWERWGRWGRWTGPRGQTRPTKQSVNTAVCQLSASCLPAVCQLSASCLPAVCLYQLSAKLSGRATIQFFLPPSRLHIFLASFLSSPSPSDSSLAWHLQLQSLLFTRLHDARKIIRIAQAHKRRVPVISHIPYLRRKPLWRR